MFWTIIFDPVFQSVAIANITAQVIKTIIDWVQLGHFNWKSLFRGAGMPSSHTATVVSLALAVYLFEGLGTLFLVTFFFASIVIRDVIGDKVFATHQERIINKLVQQMFSHNKVEWNHLIGHTLTEVFVGMVLGVAITLGVFFLNGMI